MPFLGLAAVLGWNYANHRAHRSTMCGVTRATLPFPAAATTLLVGLAILLRHLKRGYPI